MTSEEKQKIIAKSAKGLGRERTKELLTECAIDLAGAILQRQFANRDCSADIDLLDSLDDVVVSRIADVLIVIDIAAEFGMRRDIRIAVNEKLIRHSIQNLSRKLP